jgi:hypothetical protein
VLDDKWPEKEYIIGFARRVHARGELSRFSVFGLSAPDITEYLPVGQLVPGAESWDSLRSEHRLAKEAAPKKTEKKEKKAATTEAAAPKATEEKKKSSKDTTKSAKTESKSSETKTKSKK